MKAVIPAAGQGTRLYPQTHTTPKPMIRLAGRPILGHILDSLLDVGVTDAVVVVGTMKEQVIDYAERAFGDEMALEFVEQDSPEGLGHAVYQAREAAAGEPLFVLLGDMLFENDYAEFLAAHERNGDVDGSIGVKPVEDPRRYGVVSVDDGVIVALEEKPDDPPSNLAISGAYIVEDSEALFAALGDLIEAGRRGAGDEYQLTDALSAMVTDGARFGTFDVGDWYDCGRPETLLAANRALLAETGTGDTPDGATNAVVVPPADLGEDVVLEDCVVGPDVSVDHRARITHSIVSDAIIGADSELTDVNLTESIVGANTTIAGQSKRLNVGDSSSVRL